MAIISVSGKINSGKDTVGKIIQYLCSRENTTFQAWGIAQNNCKSDIVNKFYQGGWDIVKWADKLKDMVCILLSCTREQLEDREFKETELGEEWTKYAVADGFIKEYIGDGCMGEPKMKSKQCSKEEYEEHYRINWQTAYKTNYTPRVLLQYIGTDLFRKFIHENVWVNATLNNYDYIQRWIDAGSEAVLHNWIITDTRFPNEADAVKSRGGINIRLQCNSDLDNNDTHISETALDFYKFDYVVNNNGTIEELIEQIKQILIKENII